MPELHHKWVRVAAGAANKTIRQERAAGWLYVDWASAPSEPIPAQMRIEAMLYGDRPAPEIVLHFTQEGAR